MLICCHVAYSVSRNMFGSMDLAYHRCHRYRGKAASVCLSNRSGMDSSIHRGSLNGSPVDNRVRLVYICVTGQISVITCICFASCEVSVLSHVIIVVAFDSALKETLDSFAATQCDCMNVRFPKLLITLICCCP